MLEWFYKIFENNEKVDFFTKKITQIIYVLIYFYRLLL